MSNADVFVTAIVVIPAMLIVNLVIVIVVYERILKRKNKQIEDQKQLIRTIGFLRRLRGCGCDALDEEDEQS